MELHTVDPGLGRFLPSVVAAEPLLQAMLAARVAYVTAPTSSAILRAFLASHHTWTARAAEVLREMGIAEAFCAGGVFAGQLQTDQMFREPFPGLGEWVDQARELVVARYA